MRQTDRTAIVLRFANYQESDRMLTLFSPTQGRIDALARGCRKHKSAILCASDLFCLGDFELYQKGGRNTIVSATLTESFFHLREDFDRLTVGTYLLNAAECIIQPGVADQELFMLLLHTLTRLTYYDQPWQPLLAGFLLHLSACEGFMPCLDHCVHCEKPIEEGENTWFDTAGGGVVCRSCRLQAHTPLAAQQLRWMRKMIRCGSASWVNTPDCTAPLKLLRDYVESRLDRPLRAASMLPRGD